MPELFSRKQKNLIGLQGQSYQLNMRVLVERKEIRGCGHGFWIENHEAKGLPSGTILGDTILSNRKLLFCANLSPSVVMLSSKNSRGH